MKKTLVTLAVALVAPLAAQADVTANVALTTKYKFRGQDQSDPAKAVLPAIQGGFDWSSSGFYLGNWNSSIDGFANGTEMDFYGGYAGEVSGIGYDVGALHYYYPGSGNSDLNTTELYGKLSYGPVSAKYSHTVSSKYFGFEGQNTGYLEVNGSYEVMSGITLVGHVGTTRFSGDAKAQGAVNYTDYKIGAGFALGSGFNAEAAYVGATKKSDWGDVNKARVVLTLSKAL